MEASNQDEDAGGQLSRQYSVANVKLNGGVSTLKPNKRGGATLTQVSPALVMLHVNADDTPLILLVILRWGDNGAIYLIGGASREGLSFGDVHRLDFDTRRWTLVSPSSGNLPPRSGHSAVAIGTEIYVFGGMDAMKSEIYNDVHIFNTLTSSWSEAEVGGDLPQARNAHAAIAIPAHLHSAGERQMLVYGGSSPECGAFNDLFLLHIPVTDAPTMLRWDKLNAGGETPEARELHCALLQCEKTICFAGGRNQDGKVCTDMALLDVERWSWQLVPMCGWNRCSLAAGVVDGEMLSFGGFDGGQICGDCCRYSDDEESWLSVEFKDAQPSKSNVPERFGHCGTAVVMLSTSEQGQKTQWQGLLVFGGMNAEHDLNDLVLITPTMCLQCK